MLWTDKALKILKKFWKITSLKDKQIDVINELLLGNDVIGLLPTGYGKSMCYILPPLVTKKVMFIVSPLISLMDDQKEKLTEINIPCAALHGNNKNRNLEIKQIMAGEIKIVYMSPEYLINGDGMELARSLVEVDKMGFLAVDESHCISVWGQDFRPEYTQIKNFREEFPDIPIIAVTATATDTVCNDISQLLNLNKPSIVRASFDRPNLYLKVTDIPTCPVIGKKGKEKQMAKELLAFPYLEKYPDEKIIIYTNSRKDTEEISAGLNKLKKNCSEAYHAGLTKGIRDTIHKKFSSGEIKVIVCTIAFGMGIDQTVKCIIIFGSPSSIEEYYQQIGRGGRDGLACETVLFFDYSKLIIARFMMKDIKFKFPALYKAKSDNLTKIGNFSFLKTCRRKFILEYFNETCNFFTCGYCDNCSESKLTDMTDILYPLIMKTPINLSEIKKKYLLESVSIMGPKNKEQTIELDLMNLLGKWKSCVSSNDYTIKNLPDKLKLRIPNQFIKKIDEPKKIITFDDQISHYEKLFNV